MKTNQIRFFHASAFMVVALYLLDLYVFQKNNCVASCCCQYCWRCCDCEAMVVVKMIAQLHCLKQPNCWMSTLNGPERDFAGVHNRRLDCLFVAFLNDDQRILNFSIFEKKNVRAKKEGTNFSRIFTLINKTAFQTGILCFNKQQDRATLFLPLQMLR